MTNFEYYKDEILKYLSENNFADMAVSWDGKILQCAECNCDNCVYKGKGKFCNEDLIIKWLYEEYKERKEPVTLTTFEKELLNKALQENYHYIVRDADSDLYVFSNKPIKEKDRDYWNSDYDWERFSTFIHAGLFNFIKWEDEEPWKIEDILVNCEVD